MKKMNPPGGASKAAAKVAAAKVVSGKPSSVVLEPVAPGSLVMRVTKSRKLTPKEPSEHPPSRLASSS